MTCYTIFPPGGRFEGVSLVKSSVLLNLNFLSSLLTSRGLPTQGQLQEWTEHSH